MLTVSFYNFFCTDLHDDAAVQITLRDQNDQPSITTSTDLSDTLTWFSVSKHSSSATGTESEFGQTGGIVGTLSATDQDDGRTPNGKYTFSLVESFTPHTGASAVTGSQTFAVSSSGEITVHAITAELELQSSTFKLTVRVTDEGAPVPASSDKDIYIRVVAQNFRPIMSDVTVSLDESDPSVLAVITMSAIDPDGDDSNVVYTISSVLPDLRAADGQRAFQLDSNNAGQIVVDSSYTLDYEQTKWQDFSRGVVHVMVQAVDEGGAATVATCVVNIQDVNEPPTLGSREFLIGEDWASSSTLSGPALSASDPDSADSPNVGALSYTLSHSTFAVGVTSGVLSTVTTLDFEVVSSYSLTVVVTDTTLLTTSATILVSVLDVNEAPSIMDLAVSVQESSPAGSIVTVVPATDPDRTSMTDLSFSIQLVVPSLNDANFAVVKASPSSAYLRHDGALDYEKDSTYQITVQVNDGGVAFPFTASQISGSVSLYHSAVVTVQVLDVNDMDVTSVEVGGNVGQAHSTEGEDTIDLIGINLGPKSSSPVAPPALSARYGPPEDPLKYLAVGCVFQAPYGSKVRCTTVAGSGANLLWTVIIGAFNVTTTSSRTSYSAPTITAVNNARNMPTNGGIIVTVTGSSFGPIGGTSVVELQYGTQAEFQAERWHVASSCVVKISHTSFQCSTVEATGISLQWRLSVSGQMSSLHTDTSSGHAPANVTSVVLLSGTKTTTAEDLNNLDTLGGQILELNGENFGANDLSQLSVSYGNFLIPSCFVVARHSRIRCTTVPGCGNNHKWVVRVGPIEGFPTHATRTDSTSDNGKWTVGYSVPTLASVSGDNIYSASTSGDDFVLLRGTGFGTAAGCSTSCRTTGVCGKDVGVTASYGPISTIGTTKYSARCCEVLSDTSMQCLMAPGAGRTLQWEIDVCGQESAPLNTDTAYGPPVVGSYGAAGSRALSTEGGETITLNGVNFGPAGAGHIEEVMFGTENGTEYALNPTTCSVTVGHRQITCVTTKGGGKNHKWFVKIAGQKSTVPTTSYMRPTVLSIEGIGATDASMNGGELVLVRGENFGPLPSFHDGRVFLDSVHYGTRADPYMYLAKECTTTISSTLIQCLTAPGSGRELRWTVTVANQASPLSTAVMSYGSPTVLTQSPMEGRTAGFKVVMEGINMAPSSSSFASSSSILLGTTEITTGITITNTGTLHDGKDIQRVEFFVPQGVGLNLPLVYRLHSGTDRTTYQSSAAQSLSYSLPSISSIHVSASINDAVYPYTIMIEGTNFCNPQQLNGCASLSVDGSMIDTTEIIRHDHTYLTFKSIAAGGLVRIAWKSPYTTASAVEASFSSLSPTLFPNKVTDSGCERNGGSSVVDCQNVPTKGGTPFTVYGVRFGTDGAVLRVTVGDAAAKILSADLASNIQSVTFETPAGQGLHQPVRVSIVANGGSSSQDIGSRVDSLIRISYSPPSILSPISGEKKVSNIAGYDLVNNGNGPKMSTLGGVIRVLGSNFGVTGTVVLRGSSNVVPNMVAALEIILWDHEEVRIRIPPGYGSGYQLFVESGGQNTVSEMFRYETPVVFSYILGTVQRRRRVLGATGGTRGGDLISILGSGFFATATEVKIGGVSCHIVSCNHTIIEVNSPVGAGTNNPVVVTVGGFSSNIDISFAYPLPFVRKATPNRGSTSGMQQGTQVRSTMVLVGDNFGAASLLSSERAVFFGGVDVTTHVVEANHTHIVLFVPPQTEAFPKRTGLSIVVVVKEGASSSTSSVQFSYSAPMLASIRVVSCSFAEGRNCNPLFPVPTDGCHDWSFPRLRLPASEAATAVSDNDRIVWSDDSSKYYRTCTNPVYVELSGENLGKGTGFVASVAGGLFNNTHMDCKDKELCVHDHRRIVLRAPKGFGSPPMEFSLNIQGETSNAVDWSFAAPKVIYRGSCGFWEGENSVESCRSPYNARGTPFVSKKGVVVAATAAVEEEEEDGTTLKEVARIVLEIQGDNFGHEDPKDTAVVIGSRLCHEVRWHATHSETGRPYITCKPEEDIVGIRSGSIFLGGQNASVSIEDEAFVATCQASLPSVADGTTVQYYGGDAQLCSACPVGAICTSSPDHVPVSSTGFYRLELPTIEPTEGFADSIQQQSFDRAQGLNGETRRCATQQLLNSALTPDLVAAYPYAVRPATCYDFVACEPRSACSGQNKCNHGYEYLFHQCRGWERRRNDACLVVDVNTVEDCRQILSTLNGSAMVHSSGTIVGVESMAELPQRYRPDSLKENECLVIGKSAVMSKEGRETCAADGGSVVIGLENRTCTSDTDCTGRSGVPRPTGQECSKEHPEDCSRCVFDSENVQGEKVGMCSCESSTRCSMCTVGK